MCKMQLQDEEKNIDTPDSSSQSDKRPESSDLQQKRSALWSIVSYIPRRCRYDVDNPPAFSMTLNLLFGFAGTFTVANLYYNHPILNKLAEDFHVTNERASLVPTLAQTGYAAGLLFLCPLGDIFPRRPFVLVLVWFTATTWIGLCVTTSFPAFLILTFSTSLTTVTPQIMLPLVAELAPPNRRATALSIVVSGLVLGILIARVLSGVVTNYTSWRNIYWMAFGLQYLILGLLWLFLPNYPSMNPGGLNYFKMLWSILTLFPRYPLLVQTCLISFCTSATFTNFWTTLTFLLSSPPYNYSPLLIGLFALIGIFAMFFGPPFSRFVIDRLPTTLYSVIIGEIILLAGVTIGTYTGRQTIAGPIIQAFLIDLGLQSSQIANRSAIYSIEPKARNRVNTGYMLFVFTGQLSGTAIGNRLYAKGGWLASGSTSVGFIGLALILCVVRGPNEQGWIGWTGGWPRLKRVDEKANDVDSQTQPAPISMEARPEEKSTTVGEKSGT